MSLMSRRELDEDGSGGGCPVGARQELEEINGQGSALAPGLLSRPENLGTLRSDSYVAHGPDPISSQVKSPPPRRHTRPPMPEKTLPAPCGRPLAMLPHIAGRGRSAAARPGRGSAMWGHPGRGLEKLLLYGGQAEEIGSIRSRQDQDRVGSRRRWQDIVSPRRWRGESADQFEEGALRSGLAAALCSR
jgi:hypothetical protein